MVDFMNQPLVRISLVWPGPDRSLFGEISFVVEYEGSQGCGCVLLSPEEMEELKILAAYGTDRLIPVPLQGVRYVP